MNIGKAIRTVRLTLGFTQRAGAAAVGVSHVHLNNIENGRASPTLTMLEKFYEAWGVDLYIFAACNDPDRIPWRIARQILCQSVTQISSLKGTKSGPTQKNPEPHAKRKAAGGGPDGKRNAIRRRANRPDRP